ncbi:MAG: PAS domain-containing protein [Treponema sp.]|nr:PAS domain-containing protein [Treponema sp.]
MQKLNKLSSEQVRELLVSAADEIDRLETVLDSLREGVLVCDEEHCLIMANRRAKRYLPIFGDDEKSEKNKSPVWGMIRDEKVSPFLKHVLESGDKALDREFYVEHANQLRLLSLSVLPLVRNGHVSGSLIHIEDITEKRRRESRMRRMESLASLTTMAAGVAHEIKNPLGSLSIHVQLIQKALNAHKEQFVEHTALYNTFENYLGIINEEIDRLNHIVVDFLFAVRPMDMEPMEGDVNAFLKETLDFVSFELEENNIEWNVDFQEDLPLVCFDERYMKQATLNLIKNAIAAMPEGGVLSIKTAVKDSEAIITVADTGEGISEENLPKIFEPYFTTKATGSGLGLTLVYKIIHEHKGEITVKSKPGNGASFIINLPIVQKDLRSLPEPRKADSGDEPIVEWKGMENHEI